MQTVTIPLMGNSKALCPANAESRHRALQRIQRRHQSQRLQSFHRTTGAGLSSQPPDCFYQDVLSHPQEFWLNVSRSSTRAAMLTPSRRTANFQYAIRNIVSAAEG